MFSVGMEQQFIPRNNDGNPSNYEGSGEEQGQPDQRRRQRLTKDQRRALDEEFRMNQNPNDRERKALGLRLGLDHNKVKYWYQNKRTSVKLKSRDTEAAKLRSEIEGIRSENANLRSMYARLEEEKNRILNELNRAVNELKTHQNQRELIPTQEQRIQIQTQNFDKRTSLYMNNQIVHYHSQPLLFGSPELQPLSWRSVLNQPPNGDSSVAFLCDLNSNQTPQGSDRDDEDFNGFKAVSQESLQS